MIRIAHVRSGPLEIAERIIVDHELVLILDGHGEVSFPGETVRYRPHDLLVIGPFVPHRFSASGTGAARHLAVHFDLAPGVPPTGARLAERRPYAVVFPRGLALPRVGKPLPGDGIEPALLEIVRRVSRGGPTDAIAASGLLQSVLARLLESGRPAGVRPEGDGRTMARLDRAVERIEREFASPLAVADLAKSAGLSPSRFTVLFTGWTGSSPYEYLRRFRIRQACRMLESPDLSVKQVAARTGFADAFHFSKAFHALIGVPPTRFRDQALAGRASRK